MDESKMCLKGFQAQSDSSESEEQQRQENNQYQGLLNKYWYLFNLILYTHFMYLIPKNIPNF